MVEGPAILQLVHIPSVICEIPHDHRIQLQEMHTVSRLILLHPNLITLEQSPYKHTIPLAILQVISALVIWFVVRFFVSQRPKNEPFTAGHNVNG